MNSEAGQEALFMYATEGILIIGEDGKIQKINPAAERMFGYHDGELLGQNIEVLIPAEFVGRHYQHREKYIKNSHPRSMGVGMDLYAKKKDNAEFPVEISLSPYTSEGETFVIAFIIDITARKLSEQRLKNYSADLEKQVESRTMILREAIAELEKTKEELNSALQKEKDLNDLKSRFVSMASHEFRTPLTTILSSASLVEKYGAINDMEKQAKHLERIKVSVQMLTDVLDDMLSVSKLEEGRVKTTPEKFDLHELVEDIGKEMNDHSHVNTQRLKISYEGDFEVFTDKKIVRHILSNLVSNAMKFSPEDKEVQLSAEVNKKQITFVIRDQGIGISEEDRKHLFERFFRAENASNIQGTGLGLNIVAKYVELLGGTITVDSKLNKGTVFIVSLLNLPENVETYSIDRRQ